MTMKTDKLLHFLCGYVIAITLSLFVVWLGPVVGVLAAFGKEFIYDKWMGKGTFEWQDINVTLVGVLSGFIVAFARLNMYGIVS